MYPPTTEYDPNALLFAPIICADGNQAPYSHGPADPPPGRLSVYPDPLERLMVNVVGELLTILVIHTPVAPIAHGIHCIPCAPVAHVAPGLPCGQVAPVAPCGQVTAPALMIVPLLRVKRRFPPDTIAPEILLVPVVKLTKPLALSVKTYCPLYAEDSGR